MEFRWVAGLTLWTMLSGPIMSQPAPPKPAPLQVPIGKAKPVPPAQAHPAARVPH
jgi:hypothetical protein